MGTFIDEGNILVMNQSKNVLVNYNFMLRVEGIYDLPCKSVHSFTKENEFEYVQEGGLNDYVHALRKPISKPFSFTVERYVGMDIIPPLPLGAELILPVILMIAPNADKFGSAKRTFVFTGCTVMSKTFGELNAEKSELLTETIVIGYREMTEVTIPVHVGDAGDLWDFDGQKVNGNSQRSARTLASNGSAQMRQWLTDEENKQTSAKTYSDIFGKRVFAETIGGKKLPRVKPAPDTGEPVIRQWLTDGENKQTSAKTIPDTGEPVIRQWLTDEEKRQTSAKTYSDIFGKQVLDETVEEKKPLWERPTQNIIGKPLLRHLLMAKEKKPPRVKPAPDTGEPVIRQWLTDGENKQTSAKTIPDTGEPVIRQWLTDGENNQTSAKTYSDIFEKQVLDETVEEKKPPQVKQAPDTGKPVIRQWLTDGENKQTSAKTIPETKDPEVRSWPKVQSAKIIPESKEPEVRKWPPTQSAKDSRDTGNPEVRKWPPTQSAKK